MCRFQRSSEHYSLMFRANMDYSQVGSADLGDGLQQHWMLRKIWIARKGCADPMGNKFGYSSGIVCASKGERHVSAVE